MSSNKEEENKPQQAVIRYVQNQSGNWLKVDKRKIHVHSILFHADKRGRRPPSPPLPAPPPPLTQDTTTKEKTV